MKNAIGAAYMLISVLLLLTGAIQLRARIVPITQLYALDQANQAPSDTFSIRIPSIRAELPVFSARINGTSWETTDRGVSYLASSPFPGDTGNSVLYGHNWPNLLGNLHNVRPGDRIFVKRNGEETAFVVIFTATVDGTESSVYAPTSDTRITLYTCAGFLDRKRFVVTAIKT